MMLLCDAEGSRGLRLAASKRYISFPVLHFLFFIFPPHYGSTALTFQQKHSRMSKNKAIAFNLYFVSTLTEYPKLAHSNVHL